VIFSLLSCIEQVSKVLPCKSDTPVDFMQPRVSSYKTLILLTKRALFLCLLAYITERPYITVFSKFLKSRTTS
jgi:hypothetical protein